MEAHRSHPHPHREHVPLLLLTLALALLCTPLWTVPSVAGAGTDLNSTTTLEPNSSARTDPSTSTSTSTPEANTSSSSGAPPPPRGDDDSFDQDQDNHAHDEDEDRPGAQGGGGCSSSPLRRLTKPPDVQEKATTPKLRINSYYGGIRDLFYVANSGKDVIFQFEETKPDSEMKIRVEGDAHEYVLAMGRLLFGQNEDDDDDGGEEEDEEEEETPDDPEARARDPEGADPSKSASDQDQDQEDDPREGGGGGGADKHVGESGSQHAINGGRYAAELQLIHYQKGTGSLAKGASVDGGLLIVCILLDVSLVANPAFAPIVSGFSFLVPTPKRKKDSGGLHYKEIHGPLELKNVFPSPTGNSLRYYEYSAWFGMGDMPSVSNPCEGVTAVTSKWLVFEETSYLGLDQMTDLSNVLATGGVPMGEQFSQMGGGAGGGATKGEEVTQFKYTQAVLVWEEDQDDLTSGGGGPGALGVHFCVILGLLWLTVNKVWLISSARLGRL